MGKKDKDIANAESGEDNERGQWGHPMEFILSCLGYAVGLGNVWRFPYLCYENGGGAFLIPYAIMLTFVGIPCFFIELSMGQYSGSGPINVWEAAPLFRGVGVGMMIISFIGCIYYNMIIAWSLYYMFASMQKVLPWSNCMNDFNTEYCYSKKEAETCEDHWNGTWFNQTCYNDTTSPSDGTDSNMCTYYPMEDKWKNGDAYTCNFTTYLNQSLMQRKGASEEYFNYGMLGISPTMEDGGAIKWDLTLTLLLSWIICFLCVIKGIKSSGKVVYFTATFPYLVLIILFFRGVTLSGALEGVKFYIIPDWSKLATSKVWVDAAGQIFFSLSVGMGGLMTFASYNKFHNNVYRDTLVVAVGNCLTSFFAGFVIFSILGHMAQELGVEVGDVARSGSGLAFIAYPEVFTLLPPGQLWSVLFFFMLLTLGLDSQFAGIENIMTAIVDNYPQLRPKKIFVSLTLCIVMFILGLTQCTGAGAYWLDLMGYYSSGWALVLMGLAEATIFPWVYGSKRLMADIEHMCGFKIYMHWWVCWTFITPCLIIGILIFNFIEFTPLSYGDYVLPDWAQALGWCMALAAVVVIPIWAVVEVIKAGKDPRYPKSIGKRIVQLMKPTDLWMPSKDRYKKKEEVDTNGVDPSHVEPPPPYSNGVSVIDEKPSSAHANPAFDREDDANTYL